MSLIDRFKLEQLKSHPKAVLATVAISCVTVGFATGLGVGKQSASLSS